MQTDKHHVLQLDFMGPDTDLPFPIEAFVKVAIFVLLHKALDTFRDRFGKLRHGDRAGRAPEVFGWDLAGPRTVAWPLETDRYAGPAAFKDRSIPAREPFHPRMQGIRKRNAEFARVLHLEVKRKGKGHFFYIALTIAVGVRPVNVLGDEIPGPAHGVKGGRIVEVLALLFEG